MVKDTVISNEDVGARNSVYKMPITHWISMHSSSQILNLQLC